MADTGNFRVQVFTADGEPVTRWGQPGTQDGDFRSPRSIAVDSAGIVSVLDFFHDVPVKRFSATGQFLDAWGSIGTDRGQLRNPNGIAIDGDGNIYIADTENHRVQKFDATGQLLGWFGAEGGGVGQFLRPRGIALDRHGNLYVADSDNRRVQVFSTRPQDGEPPACVPAPTPTPTPTSLPPGATPEGGALPGTVVFTDIDFYQGFEATWGWAVGEGGLILHTADGGETWASQESPTDEDLRGVDFIDQATGWIVGRNGTFLKTTDGGATWVEQTGGGTRQFLGVSVVTEDLIWAVNGDEILATTDGGVTWQVQIKRSEDSFLDIHINVPVREEAPAGIVGWAIGAEGVWKMSFSGGDWVVVRSAMVAPGVDFLNFSTGWVFDANCVMWKSTNGGSVWHAQYELYAVTLDVTEEGINVTVDQDSYLQECTRGRVSFISEERGWIAIAGGLIGATFDGGDTWTTQWPEIEEPEAAPLAGRSAGESLLLGVALQVLDAAFHGVAPSALGQDL